MFRRTVFCAIRVYVLVLVFSCAVSLQAATTLIAGQEPAPAAQPPSTPPPTPSATSGPPSPHAVRAHTIKIWTNEDLIGTRTPADIYLFEKEAKAAADRAAAFAAITSCFAPDQPEATAEDTQKAIDEITQSIQESENGIAQARRQLADDPVGLRTRDQSELNRRLAERDQLLERLHALQDRLQQMILKPAPSDAAPVAPVAQPQ
jgi:hypothetical protein